MLSSSSSAPVQVPTQSGSQTVIQNAPFDNSRISAGTLRLRGAPSLDRRVTWGEDVVDNEDMGKKKSKVCCIYHPTREFGESSSESSSSDDSDSSDGDDDDRARRIGGGKKPCGHGGGHGHNNHNHGRPARGKKRSHSGKRKPSPNAYEKMPSSSPSKKTAP